MPVGLSRLIVAARQGRRDCPRWVSIFTMMGLLLGLTSQGADAENAIKYCATGTIALGPFSAHIERLRESKRYESGEIDRLIAAERAGGPDFFSTQVVIKEEQSGSGDFDLNLFQGFSDPQVKYQSVTKWNCEGDDYPVVYFVGFKVSEIKDATILVSRAKGVVNVVALSKFDPNLDKRVSVRDADGSVLCQDIAAGCIKTIFYGRW